MPAYVTHCKKTDASAESGSLLRLKGGLHTTGAKWLMIESQRHSYHLVDPWQLGFQDAATPIMQGIIDLHHDIFFFLILILVFVLWMLVRALWHFNEKTNPIPVFHSSFEIIWTDLPSIILMFIAIPSFAFLFFFRDEKIFLDPSFFFLFQKEAQFEGSVCLDEVATFNNTQFEGSRHKMPILRETVSVKDFCSWVEKTAFFLLPKALCDGASTFPHGDFQSTDRTPETGELAPFVLEIQQINAINLNILNFLAGRIQLYSNTFGLDEVIRGDPTRANYYFTRGARFVFFELEADLETELRPLVNLERRLLRNPQLVDHMVEDFIFYARGMRPPGIVNSSFVRSAF